MAEINLKINLSYGDEYMSADVTRETLLWQFICWGIFLPIVALMGLVGNALTMVVLWRREMQSTTILYMRGLVVTDTGILLSAVIVLTPFACANYLHNDALRYFGENIYPVIYTPINYVVMTLQFCNVWITVAVSVERYIAICHPFRAARLYTRKKTYLVIAIICLISVLYNIPRLFASYARECNEGEKTSGSSCYYLADTELGRSYVYKIVYFNIMYTILLYVIPLASLFILNVFLIQELMRMQRRRTGTNIHDENEANLSLVLVLIVVVFIFCQSPGLVAQFDIFDFGVFLKWLAISNLLFVINSAVNFLIYTAFGRKFRKVLLRVFRRLYGHQRSLSLRGSLTTTNGYELTAIQEYPGVVLNRPRQAERSTITTVGNSDCNNDSLWRNTLANSAAMNNSSDSRPVSCGAGSAAQEGHRRSGSPKGEKQPLTQSASSESLRNDCSAALSRNDSSGSMKKERLPSNQTGSSGSLKKERTPTSALNGSSGSLKNEPAPLCQKGSSEGLNYPKNERRPLSQNGSSGSLKSERTPLTQDRSAGCLATDPNARLTSEVHKGSSVSLKSEKRVHSKNSSSESLKSDRVPLTKTVSSDSLKVDRFPVIKMVKANGVRESSNGRLNCERYPLNNCIATNGPTPADV